MYINHPVKNIGNFFFQECSQIPFLGPELFKAIDPEDQKRCVFKVNCS